MRRILLIPILLITVMPGSTAHAAPLQKEARNSPTGVAVWIRDLVLPGSEIEIKPGAKNTPIVARIAAVEPHGNAFRYDIVYYGLDTGHYDLRDYLQRRDGSSIEGVPSLPAQVHSILLPGQVKPNPLEAGDLPQVGGYRTLQIVGGVLWIAGLIALLSAGHKKRRAAAAQINRAPQTFAERLQPLVEAARSGVITGGQRAELELMLITYWRRRLGLQESDAAEALTSIRQHAVAGPLMRQLEEWLHRPDPPADVNLNDLLEPYRHVAAEETETGPAQSNQAARDSQMTTAGS